MTEIMYVDMNQKQQRPEHLERGVEPAHSNEDLITSNLQNKQKEKNIMIKDYVYNLEFFTISREEKNILFRLSDLIRKTSSFMIDMDEFAHDTLVHAEVSLFNIADEYTDDVADTGKFIFEQILGKKYSNYQSDRLSELWNPDSGILFGYTADGESYIAFPFHERNDAK